VVKMETLLHGKVIIKHVIPIVEANSASFI